MCLEDFSYFKFYIIVNGIEHINLNNAIEAIHSIRKYQKWRKTKINIFSVVLQHKLHFIQVLNNADP